MFQDWATLFASETKKAAVKAFVSGATIDLGLGYVGRLSKNLLGGGEVNNYDNNMFGIGANTGRFMGCWFPELAWTVLPEWPNIKKETKCK